MRVGRYGGVYLLAVTNRNANAVLVAAFLHRLVSVFKDYFNDMTQESMCVRRPRAASASQRQQSALPGEGRGGR